MCVCVPYVYIYIYVCIHATHTSIKHQTIHILAPCPQAIWPMTVRKRLLLGSFFDFPCLFLERGDLFPHSGCTVGLGFRVWGLEFGVWGLGFRPILARSLLETQTFAASRCLQCHSRSPNSQAKTTVTRQCEAATFGASNTRGT